MTDKGTILVVDDDHASLKLLVDILSATGYQVRPADSGKLALASAAAHPPDLILLDMRMPGLDGIEVFRRLQKQAETRNIPVILLSAVAGVPERVEGLKLGAMDFISKPFEPEELLARVETRLELHRLRTRLEQQTVDLQRAAEEWQGTFDAMNEAVWILDQDLRVLRSNKTAEQYFQRPCSEMVGRHCWEIVHSTAQPIPDCPVLRARQSRRRESMELQIGEGWFAVTADPILDATGEFTGAVHIVTDISARKRAEAEHETLQAQLIHARKMESVGRLAGGVAHDFNNLLMGVMNYAELCRDGIEPDHPIREWLDEITAAAQRAADLTRQLLAFARKQTIAPKVLDLNDAVASMLKLLRRLIGEDIDLAWLPGPELGTVKMDPSQVDQILANLTVNARDAIGGVGKLTIETENVSFDSAYCATHAEAIPGTYTMLAVSDDGCGMDEETLENIFEPFFTTKGVGEGTGLGLATVYGIVKQNNGFINVYSEPDKGTTFKIYLSRFRGEAAGKADTATPAALPGGNETILLVEDEKSIRVTAALFLKAFGYTVLAADCPKQALQLAAEHSGEIHLLITDVVMPGQSGRDLATQLASDRPQMKRLFMSGYTANVIAHRGVLDGGVEFLGKPFNRDELARKVRKVLDA